MLFSLRTAPERDKRSWGEGPFGLEPLVCTCIAESMPSELLLRGPEGNRVSNSFHIPRRALLREEC